MNVINFSLELIEVDAVSSVQECNNKLEVFVWEHPMVPRLMSMRVVWDTITMKVCKRAIHKGLLDTKKITYFLYIVPLLLKNWNLGLEILWDWMVWHDKGSSNTWATGWALRCSDCVAWPRLVQIQANNYFFFHRFSTDMKTTVMSSSPFILALPSGIISTLRPPNIVPNSRFEIFRTTSTSTWRRLCAYSLNWRMLMF